MFEVLSIKIWGTQPKAKVSGKLLNRLIEREFPGSIELVKDKLNKVKSDNENGKNRLAAAILKLANKDLKLLDNYIEIAVEDSRDVLSQAEYPSSSKLGLDNFEINGMKNIFLSDWREYSTWLHR